MKKVYRIYRLSRGVMTESGLDLYSCVLDQHGVRDYQTYEEAEDVLVDNEIAEATILPVYIES